MVGGSTQGCFASISLKMSDDGRARPMDVRVWRAFLYWPSPTARRARVALLRR